MTDKDYTCEDWGTEAEWTQIKVKVSLDALDDTIAVMNMVSNYLQIEDYSDIDLKTCYGDLIDEAILNADKTVAYVSVYQSADGGVADTLVFLRERFDSLGIKVEISVSGVNEEDWANSWKAYYKPIKIGEKIVIVPAWEKYSASPEEIVVRMDPGMAFGTGTHEEKGVRFFENVISPLFFNPYVEGISPFYLYVNVTTPEILRKVLADPQKYAPSGVYIMRIHGTFVNFLDLSPAIQQDIIKRLDLESTRL